MAGALRAPVVLFAFNRPELTSRVFATIRAARPSRLFLVCDGPRADRPGEADRCAAVRQILSEVDWPCEVERNYSDENMGCRLRVSSGIEWVFSRTEEAIFLEDDVLPEATFFRYCDELLERYRTDDRVMMICGYNLLGRADVSGPSYWFSAHPRIWGWASWRRAWQGYDVTMQDWPAFEQTSGWTRRTAAEKEGWGGFFTAVRDGRVDTWDAQATLLAWGRAQLNVIPSSNLVVNIGFGEDSTNTRASSFRGPEVVPMTFPLVHPVDVTPSASLDEAWVEHDFGTKARGLRRAWQRVTNWVRGR